MLCDFSVFELLGIWAFGVISLVVALLGWQNDVNFATRTSKKHA